MRKLFITLHLYAAAFVAPAFLLVAITGFNYLMGNKGEFPKTEIALSEGAVLDFKSPTIKEDTQALIASFDDGYSFEYIKDRGSLIQTRPTSKDYYQFEQTEQGLKAYKVEPNLQGSMMELHKGHGPKLFKLYSKIVAIVLIFVVLSGFYLGIASKVLRKPTAIVSGAGLLLFSLLAWVF